MVYTIILAILGIIILSVILFRVQVYKKDNELKKVGGIKEKYKEFISHFDDYDLNNKPTILTDRPNNYEIGWAGPTTITRLWIHEVYEKVCIQYEIQHNLRNLKRSGINVHNLPQLNKKLTWKFNSKSNQREMAIIICQDINQLIDLM